MIDLKTGLKIGASLAGIASFIPGANIVAAPLAAGLNIASGFIPPGGNKTNGNKSTVPNAVDVTNQLKGNNDYMYQQYQQFSKGGGSGSTQYTPQTPNNINSQSGNMLNNQSNNMLVPKGYFNVNDPLEKPIVSSPYSPYGVDVTNMLTQPIQQNNNTVSQNPTDTRAIKRAIYGTDDSNSLLNFNAKFGDVTSTNQQEDNNTPYDVLKQRETGIDAALGKVDTFNTISQGLSGVMGIASIINELNKKPSDKLMPPQYSTVNLDSNQSGAINYAEDMTSKSKNAQLRMMTDLGIDPVLANTVVNNSVNTQMLGAYANAENTRQSVETQQAQLNANIESQANQSKLSVDQFNIQKQMQENQLASANISQSLLSIAGSVAGIGQGKFNNFAMSEYLKNQLV